MRQLKGTLIGITAAFAMCVAFVGTASANASSYINTPYCGSYVVPNNCAGFILGRGLRVYMECWEGGPQALGSGKWFQVQVAGGQHGQGSIWFVPANAVSDQTGTPHC